MHYITGQFHGLIKKNKMDWITGEKFKSIADFTFAPKVKANDDYDNLQNTLDLSLVKDNDIIYTHTMYVEELFALLNTIHHTRVIIITHNSDRPVTGNEKWPGRIIKWFSTNVNYKRDFIESIPIGLENERWFPTLHKKDQMEWRLGQKREYKNLVYMNHDIKTNPSKRQEPYDILKNKSWITVEMGRNGRGFAGYISNIYNHKFVICPEGNGLDTHRIWETLYMGSIPIVIKNTNNSFYTSKLPILAISNWNEVTIEKLEDAIIFYTKIDWEWNMLTFEYWKNKILNEKGN
jgi:hypothetical protein